MPDAEPPRTPVRGRRVLRWLPWVIVLGLALLAYVAEPGARLDAWVLRRVRTSLEEVLGRPVSVSSVHVSPLSGRVEVRDLAVGALPPSTRAVLTIPTLIASVSPWALLGGRLELSSVGVERPAVSVWRENGRWEGPFPAVPWERKGMEIFLGILEVRDGAVSFEEKTLPLWFRAEEVRLAWASGPGGDGQGTVDSEHLSGGDAGATRLGKLHLEGALAGSQARANGALSWGGSALRFEGSADVPPGEAARASGEIRAALDVSDAAEVPLVPSMLGLDTPVTGRLRGSTILRFGQGGWSAEGRVHGEDLRHAGLLASTLDANFKASERAVEIQGLSAATMGGTFRADATVEPRKGGTLHAKLGADGMSLNEILAAGGLESGLDGRGSLEGEFTARLGEPGSARGTGTFRVVPTGSAAARGRLDALARGDFRLEGLAVTANATEARVGATTASILAEKTLNLPPLRLRMEIASESLRESAGLAEALFPSAPGESALPLDAAVLSGQGNAWGELVIEKGRPAAGTIRFELKNVSYAGVGADSLAGTMVAEGGTIVLLDTLARKGGGTFAVHEASARQQAGGPWSLRGSFDRWPADDILSLTGAPGSPSARIGGLAEIGGQGRHRSGKANLSLSEVALGPIAFATGRLEAAIEDSVFEIPRLALEGPGGSATGSGRYDFEDSTLVGSLDASRLDAALAGPWLRGLPLAGRVALSLRGGAHKGATAWSAALSPDPEVTLAGRPLAELSVKAEGDRDRARVVARLVPGASVAGEIALAAPHESTGTLELDAVPVATLLEFAYPQAAASVGGEVTGRIAWSGPLDDAGAIGAQADLHPLRVLVGAESFTAPRPARVSLAGGRISFDDVSLVSGASRVAIGGSYPLDPSRALLDLSLDSAVDLSALTAFVPGMSSAGTLTIGLKATGSPASPDLEGTARLEGGRVRMAGSPLLSADRLQAEARIEPGAIRIDRISGVVSGGSLVGTGHVSLEGLEPTSLVLEGKVTGATLEKPEGFRAVCAGDLRFEAARGRIPALTGRIDLLRGVWRRDFELDRINLLARTRAPVAEVPRPDEGMEKTTLDVTVEANDNLWLRNDLADTEARGRVEIRGTVGHPLISGHFETMDGGELRFGDVRYDLEHARVDLPAGPRLNPEFDIVASTRVQDYDIRIHLWGDTNRVESDLSSNPSLAEREILTLLLTGSRMEETGGATRAGTIEGGAATLVGGQIGSLVGSQLERWLGFEEVRIDPYQYRTTGDPTTRITLGKRLFPRVFVRTSVPLNSTETTTYEVEYQLNRNVKLSGFRTDRDALGSEARYSARTWSPYARNRRRETTAVAPREAERVSEVSFLGSPGEDASRLARLVPLRSGGGFSRRDLVEGTLKLKRHYVKEGYLEASVIASTRVAGPGLVAVEYTIERGPKVELVIQGAGDSEKKIRGILDVLWLEPSASGTDLQEEAPDRICRALREDGYFNCSTKVVAEAVGTGRRVVLSVDRGEKVRVASLAIAGASAIPEDEIRNHVLTGRETRFRKDVLKPEVLDTDVATVENLYRSRGFLSADAKWSVSLTPNGREAKVEIQVAEGPRASLRSVEVRGNQAIAGDRIRGLVRTREGDPFDALGVYEDLERLRALYDAEGYLNAKVVEDLRTDGESVDLAYVIEEGERKTLAGIEIEGNLITQASVIRQLVPLAEGDPISHESLQKIQTDLSRTGLFGEVRVSCADAPGRSGGQTLTISVRETNDLILGTGVGYDTYNGPRVQLDVANANLRGSGWYSGLALLFGSKVQRQQLTFRAPRAVRGWMPILGATHYNEVRDTFTQTGTAVSAALERKTPGSVTHILRYTASTSNVHDLTVSEDDIHATEPRLDLGQVRLSSLGYSIARDRRDNPLNTTRGTYMSADLRVFSEILGSQQRFSKLFLQGGAARPLPGGLTGVTGVKVGVASRLGSGVALPLQERYFAGGASTARGFPQDRLGYVETEETVDESGNPVVVDKGTLQHDTLRPLGGEAVIVFDNELRRPIYGGVSGILFWDCGSVFPTPDEIRLRHLRNTLGTGVRFDTPIGPVRIEFGWKLDPRKNESAGEFVFTIGQSF